jgi:S-adenosylmethionine:tRNA ribosyltransferase-isomerase
MTLPSPTAAAAATPSTNPSTGRPFTLSDFDFILPENLIAQHPAAQRSGSRLLDGRGASPVDRVFHELPRLLQPGDLLVLNDTRVVKARLFGEQAQRRAKVELLVERVLGGNQVAAHLRVSKKPAVGSTLTLATAHPARSDAPRATLAGPLARRGGRHCFASCSRTTPATTPTALMERHGHVPLPPYIDPHRRRRRMPTATRPCSHAMRARWRRPTAALHFDAALLATLKACGHRAAPFVTLHVGAGTFQPVKTENASPSTGCTSEWYHDTGWQTVQALADCRARGGRIVAVGTTCVRTLESWISAQRSDHGATPSIFITPGFEFPGGRSCWSPTSICPGRH